MTLDQIIVIFCIILLFLVGVFFYLKTRIDFRRSMDMVFLRVLIPKKDSEQDERKDTTRDFKEQISLMEQLLASLKSLHSGGIQSKLFGQDYISLEYVAYKQEIYFYVVVPKKAKNLIEKQISAFYSDAVIDETEEIDIFRDKKVVK
jgi:hypothetical protein